MRGTQAPEREAMRAWVQAELARREQVEGPHPTGVVLRRPEEFSDEYAPADPNFDEGRGPEADAIAGLLCGSCCGWPHSPTTEEFYEAMRATEPTPRQRAVADVLITEGSTNVITLAYLQGAFTWRQLATAMHHRGHYSAALARYVNLHAEPAR